LQITYGAASETSLGAQFRIVGIEGRQVNGIQSPQIFWRATHIHTVDHELHAA
jgi:hypothetical protein